MMTRWIVKHIMKNADHGARALTDLLDIATKMG